MAGKTYSIFFVVFFSLMLSAETSFSQVYTWVDEGGNKHFGDRVPEKYRNNSNAIDLKKTNTTPIREANKSISAVLGKPKPKPKPKHESTVRERKVLEKKDVSSKSKVKQSECSAQFAKYNESMRCFSTCRNSNGGINRAKCPSCTNVVRPSCS